MNNDFLLASYVVQVAYELFNDGGPYHIETSPLICSSFRNIFREIYIIKFFV